MTATLAFVDTERSVHRTCPRCGDEFDVEFPSRRKRYCSRSCATKDVASVRTAAANSNWRGGRSSHPLIDIYYDMVGRCHRPTHKRYTDYGARGITVCERWRQDFWAFVADMGERPEGLTLDRADNDLGYSPENCRWATYEQQRHNRRPQKPREKCPNGHDYTPENTRIGSKGFRECIKCSDATKIRSAASSAARKRGKRAAATPDAVIGAAA